MIKRSSLAKGHVLIPAAAIGGLALVLAAGLDLMRFFDRFDYVISNALSNNGELATMKYLPKIVIWSATGLLVFGLAAAMLAVPGQWRRVVLWITSLFLVAAWAPVLALASHAPEISATLIATFWSGLCALVYAAKHQMPADDPTSEIPEK